MHGNVSIEHARFTLQKADDGLSPGPCVSLRPRVARVGRAKGEGVQYRHGLSRQAPAANVMSWALQWLPSRLATHCGSGRLYDSQWIGEGWADPPRCPELREWLDLLSAWHRLLHSGSPEARSKNWPIPPPSIWKFCDSFDLPVPDWAVENASRHGWTDQLAIAEKQAERMRISAP